jgi:tetratricopeptide (TPR) repeat protein
LEQHAERRLIRALHFSDFVVERNSEWNFTISVRRYLNECLLKNKYLYQSSHALLYDISSGSISDLDPDTTPKYLLNGIGRAYHKSAIHPSDGLKLYIEFSKNELTGAQWLLGKLAVEQQEQGILPATAIEPSFLRGMTLYREKRFNDAAYYLNQVTKSNELREEVAIACHLVGKIESSKPGMRVKAEELLRRSLKIGEAIDHKHHQAQALHTLGQLIGKDRNRTPEAEELLRRSLKIGEKQMNRNHQAQVLFSLGKLTWENNPSEAADMLQRSIDLNRSLKNIWAQKMVQRELERRLGTRL